MAHQDRGGYRQTNGTTDDPWTMKATSFKKRKTLSKHDLDAFYNQVIEALFRVLPQAFPEFGWERNGDGWKATNREHTKTLPGEPRPDRVVCNKPQGFWVHGPGLTLWLAYVNDGVHPSGAQYFEALKALATRAGMDASILDRESTAEDREKHEAKARRHRGTC